MPVSASRETRPCWAPVRIAWSLRARAYAQAAEADVRQPNRAKMMIPVYARNAMGHKAINNAIGVDNEGFCDWRSFAQRAAAMDIAIVFIDEAHAEETFGRLQSYNERHATRIVLVLDEGVRNETLLGRVSVSSVVRLSGASRQLTAAVASTNNEVWRHKVAATFAVSDLVPPLIKEAIAYSCVVSRGPPRTVQAVASAIEREGAFPEWTHTVYEKQDSLGLLTWARLAAIAGAADTAFIQQCAMDAKPVQNIEMGLKLGQSMGVSGTPTILLNGWRYAQTPTERELLSAVSKILRGETPD